MLPETPYRLAYGSDAVIPIELREPSPRTMPMTKESNELACRAKLHLGGEDKERAREKEEVIKQQMMRKCNKKVKP